MLKIFSFFDRSVPGESWLPLFTPFWGMTEAERTQKPPFAGRLDRYQKTADSLFTLVSRETADVAVFPYGWETCQRTEGQAALRHFLAESSAGGPPVVVFEHGDLNHPIPEGVRYSFHHCLYRSRLPAGAEVVPPLIADPLVEWERPWRPRNFSPLPIVSFRGVAPPLHTLPGPRRRKEILRVLLYRSRLLKATSPTVGYAPRVTAIQALRRSRSVRFRNTLLSASPVQWRCGYMVDGVIDPSGDPRQLRQTYLDDLEDSDYVLCVRGQGNYSLRLFETLAMGRIPVVLDTDVVLPFDDEIDWRSLVVWIPSGGERSIGERVAAFHQRLGTEQFQERQVRLREVFEHWIEPAAFFSQWARRMKLRLQCEDER